MTKTILITGATDGIGLLTAQKLASEGHKVLIHGRSADKLTAAADAVGGRPQTYRADLSRMEEVETLAQAVIADHGTLDVVINNAGVLKSPIVETEAGRDIRFDVNTIAPYILALRLLPRVPNDGRIVNLSSAAQSPVDLNALRTFRPMGDMDAYAQSKLAITIWTAELAKALPEGPVVVSVNPGSLLASKMVKDGFGIAGNDLNIGADILIRAALGDDFATASGRYFDNDSGDFGPIQATAAEAASLMQALYDITGLSF
ncbi:SDR family NAD(P)-dependent oxidoreductase [Pseudooctadecabacter jejudonensis]|uniref:Fatty acyl-CoA reductase n=1 Tax=Pseudooctadecabacter jejudonensis TaxID=1391910 RepID=A0A1Y5RBP5_9RHOB|nr:SDR family NAD(P)-dependent oxidoreductase [Pseudooctadecabacter jejudonensis]SLN13336.1 Fatty acyl-CoA reductase [Pseudooctadecabacter jejudonensis]